MFDLNRLRERRDTLERFGIAPPKRVVIPSLLIESEDKDLAQYCDHCKDITSHTRIKYARTQGAIRCVKCSRLTLLGQKKP